MRQLYATAVRLCALVAGYAVTAAARHITHRTFVVEDQVLSEVILPIYFDLENIRAVK